MTRGLMLCSGLLTTLLLVAGCAKQVPVSPDTGAASPPVMTPTDTPRLSDNELARRQQEMQAGIEEKERRVVEESMRQRFGEQTQTMAQEEFLNRDVLFAYDSYTLSEEAKTILGQKSAWLTAHVDAAVQIEGHCDERGTVAYNLALGERRANTVKQYLAALGIDNARLSTISYGEEFPLDTRHTEDAWTRNRRAHFAIIKQ